MQIPYNKYPQDKCNVIIKLYQNDYNTVQIAKIFNTYNTTIRRILLRNDIVLRPYGQAQSKVKNNPFKSLSIEAKYWIGFLIGDGSISRNRIVLTIKDLDHLEKFKIFLGNQVNIFSRKSKYNTPEHRISFHNLEISKFLKKLGMLERKTFTAFYKLPMDWHFLRGLFDADGCVTAAPNGRLRCEIVTGSKKLKNQIIKFLMNKNIKYTFTFNKKLFYIRVSTQSEIYKFYNLMYKNTKIYLVRKKQKFDNSPSIKKFMDANTAKSGKP